MREEERRGKDGRDKKRDGRTDDESEGTACGDKSGCGLPSHQAEGR